MEKRINETAVPREYHNQRIDLYLSKRFTYLSRTSWQRELRDGKISLNGTAVYDPGKKIGEGDLIRFDGRDIVEPDVDSSYRVLYDDEFLVAVDKPGNLPVHPSGCYFNNTLQRIMESVMKCRLFPIHRLDRETSGVIVLAKRRETASAIQKDFSRVQKSYIAIVHGNPGKERIIMDVPLGFDPDSVIKKKRIASPRAPERAVTVIKKVFSFGHYALVKAWPQTGRLHQIRVHLHYAGFPVVGDKLYGRDETLYLRFIRGDFSEDAPFKPEFHRSALHSRSLRLFHPHLERDITIKAPLPMDFREFIQSVGGNDG